MKRTYSLEFVFQATALVVALIVVHAFYIVLVRPRADAILTDRAVRMQESETYVETRSTWVIIRDYEQESCFILMLWAFSILGSKSYQSFRERQVLEDELVPVGEGMRILPEDAREYARHIHSLPPARQVTLLPRALLTGLQRFAATRGIQDAATTAHAICAAEAERLESELSMVRYIAWAIPSIGFIGTVRGIGEALTQAPKAVAGDISGVTQSLGVAFNSTFIALLISIVLMFVIHQLQLQQERLVLDTGTYIDQHLIQHLQVPV